MPVNSSNLLWQQKTSGTEINAHDILTHKWRVIFMRAAISTDILQDLLLKFHHYTGDSPATYNRLFKT